jgi:hypothetical protein
MKVPPSRKWNAWLDLMPVGSPTLRVAGEVETPASNHVPKLTEASPQGFNPKILILDLDIVDTGGTGTPAFGYRDASFEKRAERDQYTHVEIRFHGSSVVLLEVSEVH